MNKRSLKVLGKALLISILFVAILFGLGVLIKNNKGYELRDVIFVEGIIALIIGALSSIGGRSMGLAMNALGQSNAQYQSTASIEITKREDEKFGFRKVSIDLSLSNFSLLISGFILVILNYII